MDEQKISREDADALAGRLCGAAAFAARSEAEFLEVLAEFDASGAVRWQTEVKSVAHWLGYSCSMTPGVAREHVRVARGLRVMPTVRAAFAAGELSYSKVREITRVAGKVDEGQFCELAKMATASQLARTVSAYRAASGQRVARTRKRSVTWWTREDGMVELRGCLEPEEGACLIAALTAAKGQFGTPQEAEPAIAPAEDSNQVDTTPTYSNADALLDVARVFLKTAPEDRSGEDRTLVVVHVSAHLLADDAEDVPAGTFSTEPTGKPIDEHLGGDPVPACGEPENVPAGTFSDPQDQTCFVEGVGPVEPQTARRLACDRPLLGAVVDAHGDVLALGRTRRLVSRAQRRALMIRDRMCRFPGCAQTRHLDAHHAIPWSAGGLTDLDNLVLLCGFHHTAVHEGGMRLHRDQGRWVFLMPDGRPHKPWYTAESLPAMLRAEHDRDLLDRRVELGMIDSSHHSAARTIRPGWGGERFDLGECVRVLFGLALPDQQSDQVLAA